MGNVILNGVMDCYDEYAQWVFEGRTNEDRGDNLRRDLIEIARGFFFNGTDVDESSVDFANSNSDLKVKIVGKRIQFEIPKGKEKWNHEVLELGAD